MHISLGGLFNICKIGGGGGGFHTPPEKVWKILCIFPLNAFPLIWQPCYNFVLAFMVGQNYHFEKLGQRDLNKNM